MADTNISILLIENQYSQFEKIYELLYKQGYVIYPSIDEYKNFMDGIRVIVDNRYAQKRVDDCVAEVKEYLTEKDISLLLIDYKLSGNYLGSSGVSLWLTMHEFEKLKDCPCIFLSRLPYNSAEVQKDIEPNKKDYEKRFLWVEKGYAGMNILEPSYFKIHVLDKIANLVEGSAVISIKQKIDEYQVSRLFEDQYARLEALAAKSFYTAEEKKLITELHNFKKLSSGEINKIFDEKYKYLWDTNNTKV